MKIDSYEFGRIVIDGEEYRNDVIIFPDHVKGSWWRKEGHRLHLEDISEILEEPPEILVIGKGAYGRMDVPAEVKEELKSKNIEVKIAHTKEATQIHNQLEKEGKEVVAAFHLTC